LAKLTENPNCFGQVINIGNDEEVTIQQLAERVIQMTNSKSEIKYISYDEAYGEGFEDMQRRVPNLEKANKLINYKPTKTLNNIIEDVAQQFREELGLGSSVAQKK
jgi:UDP-glucose 4-epimerase